VSEVGILRWCANRYRVLAFVAEGDLVLAIATSLWFRDGHGYHKQQAQDRRRSHHAKDRHIAAHTNPAPLCGLVLYLWLATLQARVFFPHLG